eukprot:9491536-Pyramimonas_sp.AAC.1
MSGVRQMMTVIRNVDTLWSVRHKRWVMPHEMLLFQGFAVRFKAHGERVSFDASRPHWLPRRTGRSILQQTGNSMHVHVIGLALLWSVLYVVPKGDPPALPPDVQFALLASRLALSTASSRKRTRA